VRASSQAQAAILGLPPAAVTSLALAAGDGALLCGCADGRVAVVM
jgi:hypothetical protein